MFGERRLTDAARIDLSVHGFLRELACGFGDLGAAAVVDAVVDGDDVVVDGHLLGDVEFLDDAAPHPGPRTHPAHVHAHRVEVFPSAAYHFPIEAHQEAHLLGAAPPVLGGERIHAEMFDADFDGAAGDVNEDRLAHLVTLGAVEPALGGPSAVAVHDDRDVVGYLVGGNLRCGGLGRVLRRPGGLGTSDSRQVPEAIGDIGSCSPF